MRSRIFFAILIGFSTFFSPTQLFGEKKRSEHALRLKQQVDLEIFNLQKNITKAKSTDQQLKILENVENKIRVLRGSADPQSQVDELYMDVMMICLEQIPRDAFQKNKCDVYKKNMLSKFDPTAQNNQPHHPAVKKAVGVLKSLCR